MSVRLEAPTLSSHVRGFSRGLLFYSSALLPCGYIRSGPKKLKGRMSRTIGETMAVTAKAG